MTSETLLAALETLPPTGGIVLRGLDGSPDSVAPLGVLTEVVAASRQVLVATENLAARTLLVLLVRTGRDLSALSAHPEEAEVALRPGSAWRRLPDPVVHGAPLPVVALEELDPAGYTQPTGWPATLEALTEQVGELLRGARSAPPVPVTRPGRFVGPWPSRDAGPSGWG
ncbi:MAG: hypothetical protein LBU50_05435 [Cellulomonas sp.]|jgi:hypothetical protein|nr:hypothetical protein [Cellulomonas sp.]